MLQDLLTESRNAASISIDRLSTAEMLAVMNAADAEVPGAVAKVLPDIARAVDEIAARLENGGRLFYIGAGTSGRLGVLDASECPPTFNVPPSLVEGIIAGGDRALRSSVEKAEDDPEHGKADLRTHELKAGDALVGIAASGRTPYVLGAIEYARGLGAVTIGLSCSPGSKLSEIADISITPAPGPEIITGSTRLRAGTATKLVLNMISTGVMIRLGYVYGNLMVNVQPTNDKLVDRGRRIVSTLTGLSYAESAILLDKAGAVRTAIVMQKLGVCREEAERRLQAGRGRLRDALGEN
jgi:N-acetylmuramic acid 6-phosphate etherase